MEDIYEISKPAIKGVKYPADSSEEKFPLDPIIEDQKDLLDRLENDESIPEKERKKTINTMLAILNYQLKSTDAEVKELE